MSGQGWYVKVGDAQKGPFSGAQLKKLAATGKLKPNHQISQDGAKFLSASRVKGLFPEPVPAPPKVEELETEMAPVAASVNPVVAEPAKISPDDIETQEDEAPSPKKAAPRAKKAKKGKRPVAVKGKKPAAIKGKKGGKTTGKVSRLSRADLKGGKKGRKSRGAVAEEGGEKKKGKGLLITVVVLLVTVGGYAATAYFMGLPPFPSKDKTGKTGKAADEGAGEDTQAPAPDSGDAQPGTSATDETREDTKDESTDKKEGGDEGFAEIKKPDPNKVKKRKKKKSGY